MTKDADQQSCPGCGRTFECGINNSEPCWCSSDFPAAKPLAESAIGCYCRTCLAALITAAQQKKEAT